MVLLLSYALCFYDCISHKLPIWDKWPWNWNLNLRLRKCFVRILGREEGKKWTLPLVMKIVSYSCFVFLFFTKAGDWRQGDFHLVVEELKLSHGRFRTYFRKSVRGTFTDASASSEKTQQQQLLGGYWLAPRSCSLQASCCCCERQTFCSNTMIGLIWNIKWCFFILRYLHSVWKYPRQIIHLPSPLFLHSGSRGAGAYP